jgi:hypothetical protein
VLTFGSLYAYSSFEPFNTTVTRLLDEIKIETNFEQSPPPMDYTFTDDTLTLTKDGQTLTSLSAAPDGWVVVRDGMGNDVEPSAVTPSEDTDEIAYRYNVPDYGRINLTRYDDFFKFNGMYLAVFEGELFPIRQTGYAIDATQPVPSFGFEGYEKWGSDRGYIFSRSLPLMVKHMFIGSGSDTFINEFPQDDIIGKLRFMSNPYMIVDKAHNLYIQTGITTGGVSLLALLFLFVYYMFTAFWQLLTQRQMSASNFGLRLGVLAAVVSYSVSSMTTDSTIPSASMFWVLLGLGYALNFNKNVPEGEKNL